MTHSLYEVTGLRVHELPSEHVELMMKEGSLYHSTPSDVRASVLGMVDFWRTGKSIKLDKTPIADMFYKLVNFHNLDPHIAYNLTEKFLVVKLFTMISEIEE